MIQIEIRQEQPADHQAVYELNKAAFGQEGEAKLVELLRESDAFIPELSLVAVAGEEVVGHILFSKINIMDKNGRSFDSLALAPMAVKPARQRQGIGGKLITHGLSRAKTLGYTAVIVLGHEAYYPKFGFAPAITWQIKPPFDVPENAFMAIELVTGGLQGVTGTVNYPEAFGQV